MTMFPNQTEEKDDNDNSKD